MAIDIKPASDNKLRLVLKFPERSPRAPQDNHFLHPTVERVAESPALTAFARASAAALTLITSAFFLLCSFNFSFTNIVRNVNVLWIHQVVQSYAVMYWIVVLPNAITLLPSFRSRASRWLTEALLLALTTGGLLMTRVYRLFDIPLDPHNIALSVAVTLPLFCFGIHDIALFGRRETWQRSNDTHELCLPAASLAGGSVGAWYFLIAWLRYRDLLAQTPWSLGILAITVALHGSMFACLAALFRLARDLMGRAKLRTQWLATLALVWLLSSVVLRKLVTPALSFNNVWADVWALSYPFAFVVMLAGWQIRRAALGDEAIPARVETMLSSLVPRGKVWTAVAVVAALFLAFAVPYSIERVDWNFLFQRLTAVAVWTLALIVSWRWFARPMPGKRSTWKNLAWCLVSAAICISLAWTGRLWHRLGLSPIAQASAAYNGMDSSLQAGEILFRPTIRDTDRTGFLSFLRQHTLVDAPIGPPQQGLVELISPSRGPKPDIYIIVVDCMRRDYLSPYNPRVNFTPHIASFAKESFVFQHAYTNYGGTALSEPAIWAGEMMPSKLYVQPFEKMNALEQLTTADGYHRLLLRDMVLNGLLREFPTDQLLTIRRIGHIGFDLRDEAPEIVGHASASNGYPLFVYAQPQNLHPITLHELVTSGEKLEGEYPGFNARFADELHKVDAAFGQLIDGLKGKGVFDNSIVILTADHGDWLGEYGRWGHGQFLLPTILEVPLFIHLPPALAKKSYVNAEQNVFLTDIAPSLLYLLGHRALRKGEFFGRPLFTETADEQGYPQRYHLFMSSYAAVFGILDEQNGSLYMADAVDDNQALYNLAQDPNGLDNILDSHSQQQFEQLTRKKIEHLEALYGASTQTR